MQVKDQLQRTIHIDKTPKRIVSLVPSQTELLCYLGLENLLVGVTKFCVHPKNLFKDKTIVGGTKQVHVDKIQELQPDIILCNKEENTIEIVNSLEAIASVHISDINSIEDCLELIAMYGQIFKIEEKASSLIKRIQNAQSKFELFTKSQPKPIVSYFIWKDPWMVVGKDTFINYMLELNGFENYFANLLRYPEIHLNKEYSEIDYVFLSSEPYPFKEAHYSQIKPYFPNAKIIIVDGEMFSWYGSRLLQSFDYFKKLRQDISK
ncbi:cobalamin-binding protein [Hanstruepera neustonica]|uniref:Cobalamin-binding protein n=1 Tax=Hanstruepera neustonica TaxID=1445657 RepID=A0A2K1DZB9_9FLAO|nr:helical backbone metal receptor [Hanstruepera neustonica]PNQ73382.1 cobalamin-binding protein [Hanstruepera neustonica]